ncbi:MAG TPA: 4-hydroxybenzoate octaprenyltransferase [Desulfovibrio sp.]|uniref:4-hydroxybenzoate octaprenyltransferase n=1 Tax=Desulfovibrio sp. TaxID=885 RepID=UPI002D138585|nr:4-hydroxybenzoate octaprenyltransferase [Desulfovibrio sp.]HMM37976.1 4-hydroxybenzoate octaprenyltransferase [Desulfovibrio sp.]
MSKFFSILRMVKIEHSIFALPFAYSGLFLAAGGWPGWWAFIVLTAAMVAVRSFAMAANRYLDLDIDRENPRTQDRPLVTGELTKGFTLAFIGGCALVFVGTTALMNPLCLKLAIPALLWSGFYSLTKRFTWLCHYVLGSVLGLAPIAGWISIRPEFAWTWLLLALAVTLWVAGFDILYACQDVEFDRSRGLKSMPASLGLERALRLSRDGHLAAAGLFLMAGMTANLRWTYFAVAALIGGILWFEHRLIKPDDLSRVNLAFFTLNGFVAILLFAGVLLGL